MVLNNLLRWMWSGVECKCPGTTSSAITYMPNVYKKAFFNGSLAFSGWYWIIIAGTCWLNRCRVFQIGCNEIVGGEESQRFWMDDVWGLKNTTTTTTTSTFILLHIIMEKGD